MGISGRLIKWVMIYLYSGKLYSFKKEWESFYVLIWKNFYSYNVDWKNKSKI